jgi:hypothetical protein
VVSHGAQAAFLCYEATDLGEGGGQGKCRQGAPEGLEFGMRPALKAYPADVSSDALPSAENLKSAVQIWRLNAAREGAGVESGDIIFIVYNACAGMLTNDGRCAACWKETCCKNALHSSHSRVVEQAAKRKALNRVNAAGTTQRCLLKACFLSSTLKPCITSANWEPSLVC